MTCKDCIHFNACNSWMGEKGRIAYYCENGCDNFADKSKFIELLCDVGDTAYIISPTGEIIEAKIERLVISKDDETKILGVVLHDGSQNYGDYCKYAGAASEFKTVFFTKEEAEKVLKERERK